MSEKALQRFYLNGKKIEIENKSMLLFCTLISIFLLYNIENL
jgi:hypothetical protein